MDLSKIPLHAQWFPGSSKKLMVVLHGRGDSPAGFAFLPGALQITEMNYLLLQAPDDYYDGYSWYPLPPDQLPGVLRSRRLLEETFSQLMREGYKPEHTFIFGFSQGCLMTLEFGSRWAHRLAGYIGVSGYAFDVEGIIREATPEARSGDWLITHGTQDDVLPVETTRAQMLKMQDAGFKLEYVEYEKDHTIDETLEIADLRRWILKRL